MPYFYLSTPNVRTSFRLLSAILLFVLCSFNSQAQKLAVNSGPWSDNTTWGGTGVPVPGDAVSIASGVSVTVDVNASVAAIQVNNGASAATSTLSLDPGVQLTVAGTVSLGAGTGGGALNLGSGTLTAAGFAASGSGTNSWTSGTGTVILNGNNTLPAVFDNFYNLTVQGGVPGDSRTTHAGAPLSVSNNLTVASSSVLDMATFALTLGAAGLVLDGTIETQSTSATALPAGRTWGNILAGTGAVLYNAASGGQTVAQGTYNNLYISHASGGESSASGDIIIGGEVATLTTGTTLNMGTFQLAAHPSGGIGSQTNVGTIRTQHTATLLPVPSGRNWGGTIQYDAPGGGQKIVFGTYNNLTVLGSGSDESSSIVVNGLLVTGSGITIDMNQETLGGTFDATGHAGNLIVRGSTPFAAGKTFGGTVTYATNIAQTVRTGSYNNLSISNFRQFDLTLEAGTISVAGNLLFNAVAESGGTIISTGSVFNFNGSAAQNITVTARQTGPTVDFVFTDVTLSGGGTKTLLSPVSIAGLLTLTDGVLISTATELLTLQASASTTGASTASYVQGPLHRLGTSAFVFPVGGGGVYAPIGISAPGAGGDFTATYNRGNPKAVLGSGMVLPVMKVSACEYWNLQKAGGANTPTVTLFWSPESGCNGPGAYVSNTSTLVPVRFNGAAWESMGQSAVSGSGGLNGSGSVTSDPATAFDNITLGSTSNDNLLPVRFISVSAQQRSGSVDVRWTTAAEFNVARYEVQRSADGRSFTAIGIVPVAQGTGGSAQYSFTDRALLAGHDYYRVRAIDADGRVTLSPVLRVRATAVTGSLELYPVPVRNRSLVLRSDNLSAGTYELRVIDATGRVLLQESVRHSGGALSRALTLPAGIAPGHYRALLSGNDEGASLPFIVQ
ncbi:hypothetical protein [Flaviaesturariibacter aridisoli]|uniref:T9SS type A sorting domain-containing protein n=1 Tax=Flaviaesturariibacter aridisoli TaxID=2545761 RepID=A0A4R4E6F5_9BACT|nr:hypothetical protein [Flaviaesturariibacter aridisoli]TCZ74360.1 hypothetical protein E0486_01675 [Flaviaesturariibacter aridisoli]